MIKNVFFSFWAFSALMGCAHHGPEPRGCLDEKLVANRLSSLRSSLGQDASNLNRKSYLKLVKEAELEYRSWLREREKFGMRKIDLEDNLWNDYLASKKRLSWPD